MPRRILIYGVTGSGKTTLASRLSELTGIPWHSADDLAFEAGWTPTPTEFQTESIARICAQDAWILDTAYAKWLDIPLSRAELIVGLDYPRWLSFGRLLRRTVARVIDKKPICNGNVETLRLTFSRDSILLWHFRSFRRKRARIHRWLAEGRNVLILRSQRETERWLDTISEDEAERSDRSLAG